MRWFFSRLMSEFHAFVIKIRNGLPGKTSMLPRAVMNGYCCPNGIHGTTCMISLAFNTTKKGVSGIRWSVLASATRKACSVTSFSIASTLPLVAWVVQVLVPLSFDASVIISIGSSCQLYGTIYLPTSKTTFPNLQTNDVSSRTWTDKCLTIPRTTRTQASFILTGRITVPTTSALWLVTAHRCRCLLAGFQLFL